MSDVFRRCTLCALIFAICDLALGQDIDEVGKEDKVPQYKRFHQRVLFQIKEGKLDKAFERLNELHEDSPGDPETQYMYAVAYCQSGQIDKAVAAMQKSLELGLAPERFLAGTLTLLDPLRDRPEWRQVASQLGQQVVHGPMLGHLTDRSVKVWVRTLADADVQVLVGLSPDLKDGRLSPTVRTSLASDYTAAVPVDGFEPQTDYWYAVVVNGQRQNRLKPVYRFTTLPPEAARTKFRIAFGGCAGYTPKNERMWLTVSAATPAAFILTGDNVYSDSPETPEVQHYELYRRQSRPEFRTLTAGVPTFAIYDDHDFGANDCSGGPEIEFPAWKRRSWNIFRNNWISPYYGGGESQPGCWFDFSIGDVHFILVDGRYYRTPEEMSGGKTPTMLGPAQKRWLFDTLARSKGTFKVLVSPVPWVWESKGESPDTWNGYRDERTEIFDYLAKHRINGVVLMSGDRHRSDVWKIDRPNGYALYEWESARLTNERSHPKMKDALFSYVNGPSAGLMDFDLTADDPSVTGRIIDIDGNELHALTIKLSQLTH